MTNLELVNMLEKMAGYYGRKMDEHRINLIYPKVSHIPSEVVPWLLAHITDEAEQMPANIGRAVLAAWHEWQRQNQRNMPKKNAYDCPECRYGYLFVERDCQADPSNGIPGGVESAVFLCSRCNQVDQPGIPKAQMWSLFPAGWRRQPLEMAVQNSTAKSRKYKNTEQTRLKAWEFASTLVEAQNAP